MKKTKEQVVDVDFFFSLVVRNVFLFVVGL
jgi:hypothetical protein